MLGRIVKGYVESLTTEGGMRGEKFSLNIFVYFLLPQKISFVSPENSSQRTTPRCARFSRSHTRFSFLLPLWHSRNPLFKLKSKLLSLRRHRKAAKNSSRKTDSREREACYPLWDVLHTGKEKKRRRSIALQKISLTPTETSSRMEKAML